MKEELKKLINDNIKHDSHILNQIEEIEEIEFEDYITDEWDDEGKYQYGSMSYLVSYKGNQYVIYCIQMRSGSYYSDYYYQDAECIKVETFTDYIKPKKVFEFEFKNKTIIVLEDKSAKIDDDKFKTVEEAILSLT